MKKKMINIVDPLAREKFFHARMSCVYYYAQKNFLCACMHACVDNLHASRAKIFREKFLRVMRSV
ncbi:MAG TPA: hypothetical protein VF829_01545, partial [Candidatus Paceibacterota bacterium]